MNDIKITTCDIGEIYKVFYGEQLEYVMESETCLVCNAKNDPKNTYRIETVFEG